MTRFLAPLALALCLTTPALAEVPDILDVKVTKSGMGWRFDVTLKHPDTGWEHFADAWEVLDADGHRLAYRELMHPHVEEQPFTRSLSSVMLPDGTRTVFIRAKCSTEDWSGPLTEVALKP